MLINILKWIAIGIGALLLFYVLSKLQMMAWINAFNQYFAKRAEDKSDNKDSKTKVKNKTK